MHLTLQAILGGGNVKIQEKTSCKGVRRFLGLVQGLGFKVCTQICAAAAMGAASWSLLCTMIHITKKKSMIKMSEY